MPAWWAADGRAASGAMERRRQRRARGGGVETLPQGGVLLLELGDALAQVALLLPCRLRNLPFQLPGASFGDERAPAETGELVGQAADERLQFAEGGDLRSYAVGH